MITLLNGTKLPTHEEFYKLISKENSPFFNYGNLRKIKELDKFSYVFEKNNWDVVLSWIENDQYVTYGIEYKSSINEWHKKFHEFLRQINNRGFPINYTARRQQRFKLLISFDDRFEQYRKVLSENHIELIILSQEMLKKE